MLSRWSKLLLPAALFLAVGGFRIVTPPRGGAESRLHDLPMNLLGLQGQEVPVEQAILDDLDPDELVIRRYARPGGTPVWVVLIFFENKRRGGHDPELCYRSQGYRTEPAPAVGSGPGGEGPLGAYTFLASRLERKERVSTFWYTSSGGIVGDTGRYRGKQFLRALTENRTYGVFVRISTIETQIPGEAQEWNDRFVAEIARQLPHLVRE